jgi:hypothetical protein
MKIVCAVAWTGCRRNYAAECKVRVRRGFDHRAFTHDVTVAKDDRPAWVLDVQGRCHRGTIHVPR